MRRRYVWIASCWTSDLGHYALLGVFSSREKGKLGSQRATFTEERRLDWEESECDSRAEYFEYGDEHVLRLDRHLVE